MKFLQIPAHLVCFALMFGSYGDGQSDHLTSFAGCLLFLAALYFSFRLHGPRIRPKFCVILKKYNTHPLSLIFLCLGLIWGSSALLHHNPYIAVLSFIAILLATSLSVENARICYAMGFTERTAAPRAANASLLFLSLYLISAYFGITPEAIKLFVPGIVFIATATYFTGLLVSAYRHYVERISAYYFVVQAIALASGIFTWLYALETGNTLLTQVAQLFLLLYAVVKLTDLLPCTEAN